MLLDSAVGASLRAVDAAVEMPVLNLNPARAEQEQETWLRLESDSQGSFARSRSMHPSTPDSCEPLGQRSDRRSPRGGTPRPVKGQNGLTPGNAFLCLILICTQRQFTT
jgi:hypothetical protein